MDGVPPFNDSKYRANSRYSGVWDIPVFYPGDRHGGSTGVVI